MVKEVTLISPCHTGDNWPLYCKPAILVYDSYVSPNLDNLSPFEVAIGRKAILAPRFE